VTLPIAYVSVRLSAHATEDLEKVKKAFFTLLPEARADEVVLTMVPLKGHYGNPITLLEARIGDKGLIEAVVERLGLRLSRDDKQAIARDLTRILEKNDLYLRLDKQAAYCDELRLRRDDPIHIRIHFKTSDREAIVDLCQKLGLTA
jgi:RNA binding exosome subunit